MAGGMHAAVMASNLELESFVPTVSTVEADESALRELSVEVGALSEELTHMTAMVLQERNIQSNPMKAYRRFCLEGLACSDSVPEGQQTLKSKRQRVEGFGIFQKYAFTHLPVLTWMPQMRWRTIRADIIAGVTVGVMVIPQSMSYGSIAGLPYINGMYSACIPTLIYALFGQSRQLAVGPVAMVSLLVEAGLRGALTEEQCPKWYKDGGEKSGKLQSEVCEAEYVQLATLTALTVGLMQVAASILKLGFLASFLGHPVTSGFTSGAAIIIGLSQLKYILGYEIKKSQYIYETLHSVFKNIHETQKTPLILGLITLVFLIVNKRIAQQHKRLSMMGPLGPLVCCFVGTVLVGVVPSLREEHHIDYVGDIPSVLKEGWSVGTEGWSLQAVREILPTALSACLIGYMESIAIGKNLAAKHGYEIEAGQEMLAIGLSNFIGAFFSCYPVTGSFSRSAVSDNTGALTQFAGVVTAIIMFATLLFLTPLFYYLPKYVLAAIVMSSVIPLVAISEAKKLFRVKRVDFFLWVVAFIGTLFLGVLPGIALAVGLSLVIVIYESVRPQITILWRIPGTTIYRNMKQESSGAFIPNVFIARIGSSLYFANASFVKDMMLAYVSDLEETNPTQYIVLEMTAVISIDSTAVHAIEDVVRDFRNRGIQVAFAMVGNRVDKTMRKAKLKSFIGENWFFPTVNDAVEYCIRHQHYKRLKRQEAGMIEEGVKIEPSSLERISVHHGDEIGFSNEMHPEYTMAFLTLVEDLPLISAEIMQIFKRSRIAVVQCKIDPVAETRGSKHTYLLRNLKTTGKLSEAEIDLLKIDLSEILQEASVTAADGRSSVAAALAPSAIVAEHGRVANLEQVVHLQQQGQVLLQKQLEEQNKRIDMLLQIQDNRVDL